MELWPLSTLPYSTSEIQLLELLCRPGCLDLVYLGCALMYWYNEQIKHVCMSCIHSWCQTVRKIFREQSFITRVDEIGGGGEIFVTLEKG